MNEGALFSRLYSVRIAELERQLAAQTCRAEAAEAALAFERTERDRIMAWLMELGRQAIQSKEEATALRMAHATLEANMRAALGERIAKDLDQCYQNKVRDLVELIAKRLATRPLSKQDEQDLKDLVVSTLEEFRMIVRRAL
jgi:CRP-like cAMP-binding protein